MHINFCTTTIGAGLCCGAGPTHCTCQLGCWWGCGRGSGLGCEAGVGWLDELVFRVCPCLMGS